MLFGQEIDSPQRADALRMMSSLAALYIFTAGDLLPLIQPGLEEQELRLGRERVSVFFCVSLPEQPSHFACLGRVVVVP